MKKLLISLKKLNHRSFKEDRSWNVQMVYLVIKINDKGALVKKGHVVGCVKAARPLIDICLPFYNLEVESFSIK